MANALVMWNADSARSGKARPAVAPDPGYVTVGSTQNFTILYDPSLGEMGSQLGAAVQATVERDLVIMQSWFQSVSVAAYLPFNIYLVPGSDGAGHSLPDFGNIYVNAYDGTDPDLQRMLVVAEVVEVFQHAQGTGWNPGKSNGEALSRILAEELYPTKLYDHGFVTAPTWLVNTHRPDWVSRSYNSDLDYDSIGCGTLFLSYLRYQLKFSWTQIAQAAGGTLAQTYQTLTGSTDAFASFTAAIDRVFPAKPPIIGLTSDNPFPAGGCAAIASEPGRLDTFVRDYGTAVQLRYPGGPDGFELKGLPGTGAAWEDYPAAVSWAPQRADVFARNLDGLLAHWWSGDDMVTFGGPEILGKLALTSAPAAVSTTPGRLDVFAQGAGNTLLHWRYPSPSGGPFTTGEVLSDTDLVYSAPGVCATGVRINVFAIGAGGNLLYWYSTDDGITFTGPQTFNSGTLSTAQPVPVNGPRTLDVFFRDVYGHYGRLSYRDPDYGPAETTVPPGPVTMASRPAAVIWAPPPQDPTADGALHLFGTGDDGNLWHWWTDSAAGDLSGPENLGGPLQSPPAVSSWAFERLDVFGQPPYPGVCHFWYDPSNEVWGGPELLPS
jgi:hypothetical protein